MIAYQAMKPSVRQHVERFLKNLRAMGDTHERDEVDFINDALAKAYEPAEAVNFAREEDPAGPTGEGKK